MKKTRSLILVIVSVLILTLFSSCTNYSEPSGKAGIGKYYFHANVIEVYDGSIMVSPVDGAAEGGSSDLISVSLTLKSGELVSGIKAGDRVRIIYSGEIMESYPAQIGRAYDIVVVS